MKNKTNELVKKGDKYYDIFGITEINAIKLY